MRPLHLAGLHSRRRVTLGLTGDACISASSNRNMRRTLSSFVAVICLLTLFVSSAACLALPKSTATTATTQHEHVAGAPSHACCPQQRPAGEHTSTTCCTVHHQPVSTTSAVELDQPGLISNAISHVSIPMSLTVYASIMGRTDATQQPLLIALRI